MPSKSERCNIESNWILFDPKAFLCSTLAFDIKLFVSVLVNFPDFQHAACKQSDIQFRVTWWETFYEIHGPFSFLDGFNRDLLNKSSFESSIFEF